MFTPILGGRCLTIFLLNCILMGGGGRIGHIYFGYIVFQTDCIFWVTSHGQTKLSLCCENFLE